MGQTDGRIALFKNAPLRRGYNNGLLNRSTCDNLGGSVIGPISEVTPRRDRLVLGWVTAFERLYRFAITPRKHSQRVNSVLRPSGVAKSSTSFARGKGGNVEVSSRSGEARCKQRANVCRYNWHSAGSLGWPFSMPKYKLTFQIKYTETIL